MTQGKTYFRHVDGLRTVAVIGVLLAHFKIPGFSGAFLGVDVFFVISGFLITRLIIQEKARTGSFSYRRFYIRRVRRLLPAALSVIAICLAVFIPILGEEDLRSFLRSVPFAILSLANINYYMEVGYFDSSAQFKPLLHTWSLAVEEQYYLIWPTLLLLLLKLRRGALAIMAGLLLLSVLSAQVYIQRDFSAAYYLLPFRAFELLVGSILATLMAPLSRYHRDISLPAGAASAAALVGMALILVPFVVFDEHSNLPSLLSLLPCVGTALIIAYGAHGPVGRFLCLRPVVWIGLISYSLYLVHWPVVVYVAYRLPDAPTLGLSLLLFPISILLAAANYYFIEQPFRHPAPEGRRFGNAPFMTSTALLALLACAVALGTRHFTMPGGKFYTDATFAGVLDRDAPYPGSPDGRMMKRLTTSRDAPATILALGDSHAGHLRAGLKAVTVDEAHGVDVASIPACPPLFGMSRVYDDAISEQMDEVREQVCRDHAAARRAIGTSPDYDSVILSARWFPMLNQRPGTDQPENGMYPADLEGHPNFEESKAYFAEGLDETVDSLLAAGKRVVIFSQVPGPGNDLSQCQSLFPWTRGEALPPEARCYTTPSEARLQRAAFGDETIRALGDQEGVLAIIPSDIFCEGGTCITQHPETGELLFKDNNHLSTAGSIFLIEKSNEVFGLDRFLKADSLKAVAD